MPENLDRERSGGGEGFLHCVSRRFHLRDALIPLVQGRTANPGILFSAIKYFQLM
jgi:hypothetical protein